MSSLQAVDEARRARDDAERAFRQVVADAIEGGVPISKIARHLHVTRQTIYNWIDSLQAR